jgi:hypothetical protein
MEKFSSSVLLTSIFRLSNASLTCGETLLAPPVLQSLCFLILKTTFETWMESAKTFPGTTSQIFAFVQEF